MRIFEGLCLHLVAGYQVSLPFVGDNFPKLVTPKFINIDVADEFRQNGIQLGTRSMTTGQIARVLMRLVFKTILYTLYDFKHSDWSVFEQMRVAENGISV